MTQRKKHVLAPDCRPPSLMAIRDSAHRAASPPPKGCPRFLALQDARETLTLHAYNVAKFIRAAKASPTPSLAEVERIVAEVTYGVGEVQAETTPERLLPGLQREIVSSQRHIQRISEQISACRLAGGVVSQNTKDDLAKLTAAVADREAAHAHLEALRAWHRDACSAELAAAVIAS